MKIPLLFAANWDELISFGVGAVFFLVWLVNQFSDAKKKKAAGPMPAQPRPQPPRPAPMAENAAPDADPLRAQIDEFLRRANQQAQAGGPGQGKVAQAAPRPSAREEVVVLLEEAPQEARRRSPALQPAAATGQPARRPKREKRPQGARGMSVADHVADHVGASKEQFRDEVADLGERVIQADKQFDTQLHQKFDHQVGSLSGRAGNTAYDQQGVMTSPTPAADIAALLATPAGIRQAMILNEILRRPEDRW